MCIFLLIFFGRGGGCEYNGGSLDYILMLSFRTIVEKAIVCSILSFLFHPCFNIVWIVVCNFIFSKYGGIYC